MRAIELRISPARPDQLHNLAVHRSFAGRGLGVELLAWAEKHTAKLGKPHLRLDCVADNPVLSRYCQEAGFTSRGVVDAHYPHATYRLHRYEKQV